MKILSTALLFSSLAIYLSACTKSENPETPEAFIPDAGKIVAANAVAAPTAANIQYLINKDWKYFEYYTNYSSSAPKLSYKDRKASNALNLKPIIVRYNENLTYTETTAAGTTLSGTYYLSNNGTTLNIVINGVTFSSNIQLLDHTTLRWQAVDGGNYGVMMPVLPTTDTTKTLAQMLTANKWKYDIYFQKYDQPTSDIAYGTPAPPTLPLSVVTIQYNANGTFVETSPNLTLNGTWSVSGNQLSVTYSNGNFFVYTINILQTGRLEMSNAVSKIYLRLVTAN